MKAVVIAAALSSLWLQRVAKHEQYASVQTAPAEYQPRIATLPTGPYYILVGENDYFCVVAASEYRSVQDGDLFDCCWQPPWRD